MNKLFIALLIVGFAVMGFFLYKLDRTMQALSQRVDSKFSLATSTDPLVMLGQGVVTSVAQLNMNLVQQMKTMPESIPQK